MSRPPQPRIYPVDPLLELIGDDGVCVVREHLGVSFRTWRIAVEHGLTESQADRWACALGYTASNLWPVLWWANAPEWTPDEQSAVAS